MTVHDGVTQLGRARHCRVLGEVALNGRDGRVLDVLRRGEMWLAGAKVYNIDALHTQFVRFGHHRHRG